GAPLAAELGEQANERLGRLRFEHARPTRAWDDDARAVERDARERDDLAVRERDAQRAAVVAIAEERRSGMCRMHSNLARPPGDRPHREEHERAGARDDAKVRRRRLRVRTERGAMQRVLSASDRRVPRSFGRIDPAGDGDVKAPVLAARARTEEALLRLLRR